MTRAHLNLLVDTNVWLDYFLGRKGSKDALAMLRKAAENEDVVTTTPSILKDTFYLACAALKRRMREAGNGTEDDAKAVREIGWACISSMQSLSVIIPQGFGEHLDAVALRDHHDDYEDNLLLATAQKAKVDFIVTGDARLLKNKVVPAIAPCEYLDLHP